MNASQIFAAVAITLVGSAAMATEATQFNPAPGTLTRAEVKADLAHAVAGGLIAGGEASRVDYAPSVLSRTDVRAEARAFARRHAFNSLHVGS